MTKKKLSSLLIITLIMTMIFTSCGGGTKTLEQVIESDKEAAEELADFAQESGLTVEIEGNSVIYTMDLSSLGLDITEEMAKQFVDLLAEDSYVTLFSDLCKELEEETKVQGITMVVNYNNGDKPVATCTYNAEGLVE